MKQCPACGGKMVERTDGFVYYYVCLECACISRGEIEYGKD